MKKGVANFCHRVTCAMFLLLAGFYFYQSYALESHWLINLHGSYFSVIKIALRVVSLLIGLALLSIAYILVFEQRDFMEDRIPTLPLQIFLTAFIASILLFVEVQFLGLLGLSEVMSFAVLSIAFTTSVLALIFNQQLLKPNVTRQQTHRTNTIRNKSLIINPLNYRK